MDESWLKTEVAGARDASAGLRPPVAVPDHELLRCIGKGSYGEVWLARNVVGTFRAVKVVYRDSFVDARPYEREFSGIQKFEPLSRSNEGLVDILQIGRNDADGYFYYVMELADNASSVGSEFSVPSLKLEEGWCGAVAMERGTLDPATYISKTLSRALQRPGRLPFEECLDLGLSLSLTLGHLHRHGLIHRDIKPSNIIFVNGVPKLADIGLVTDFGGAQSFVGTEGFIPPEGPNSPQADIYSLGKVLYEISMGKDRHDFPEPFTAIRDTPDSAALLELNAVILKACAPDPKHRYATAEDLHLDLALLQSGKSVKKKHVVERRLRYVSRIGAAAAILAAIATAAFLFQQHQTHRARLLAQDNHRLADERRDLLVRMQVDAGNKLMEEGKYGDALIWFAEAFKLVQGDSVREQNHRIRLDSVLRQFPKIVQLFRHEHKVNWCEFSPDGKRLASASDDHTARVWNVETGEAVTPPLEHDGAVWSIEFSPDGNRVLTASYGGTARIWDAASDKPLVAALRHADRVKSAHFSPDGERIVTASSDKTAQVWDARTGERVGSPLIHDRSVNAASFSPDGNRVVTASDDRTARIWHAETGTNLVVIRTDGELHLAQFSPDGNSVLTGISYYDRGQAQLWNSYSGEPLTLPLPLESAVVQGSFSPDGRRVIAAGNNTARIWDAATGIEIGAGISHPSRPWRSVFSHDGSRVAIGSEHGTASVWDADTGAPLTPPLKHAAWVYHVAFSRSGDLLATASDDALVRIWDLAADTQPRAHLRHSTPILDARYSPDGAQIITGPVGTPSGASARLWDSQSGERTGITFSQAASASTTVFSPDGTKLLVVIESLFGKTNDTNASVWNAGSGKLRFSLGHSKGVLFATFSRDGRQILTTGADGTARVWSSDTGEPTSGMLRHSKAVTHGAFDPEGKRVVIASDDTTAQVWNIVPGTKAFPPFQHRGPVHCVEYSPDGRRIVTTSQDQTLRIWDAATGVPVTAPIKQGGRVIGACFSPDGRKVASWSFARSLNIWDSETGRRLTPPLPHLKRIHSARFSPDGRFLATASSDNTARLWDAETGEALSVPWQHNSDVWKVSFHPSRPEILTASFDGAARIWDFKAIDTTLENVVLLARLYTSYEIDQTLSHSRLGTDQIVSAFQTLQQKHPLYVSRRTDGLIGWRKSQAVAAELSRQWSFAAWHLTALIEGGEFDAELFHRRGRCRAEAGHWREAAADFRKAIELGKDSLDERGQYLLAAGMSGDMAAYHRGFDEMLREYGATNDSMILHDLATWGSTLTNSPVRAEELVKFAGRATRDHPDKGVCWATAAMAHLRAGNVKDGLECLERLKQLGGSPSVALIYLEALLRFQSGENATAAALFEMGKMKESEQPRKASGLSLPEPWENRLLTTLLRRQIETLLDTPTKRVPVHAAGPALR